MWCQFTNNNFNKVKNIEINKLFLNKINFIKSEIKKTQNVKYIYTNTKISNAKINMLKSSPWVSNKLSYDYLPYDVNIKWGHNNNIYMKTTKDKFNRFLTRLPIFLKILNYINRFENKHITIYIISSNLLKNVNYDHIISPTHVNSGYTNLLTKLIFIWREEEFEKVCFHEVIHLLDQDHRNENINIETNINGPQSFHEAITDFKAIIFNLIYLSLVTNIKIKTLFSYEYSFIKNQSIYIYDVLKIKNKQHSPAYSYFVLKYFIFKYFNKYNFNEILFNDIFYGNKNYSILINYIKNYKVKNHKYINFNSARMTLFELN